MCDIDARVKEYTSIAEELDKLDEEKKDEIYKETSDLIKYINSLSLDMDRRRVTIYDDSVKKLSLVVALASVLITLNAKFSELTLFLIPLYTFLLASSIGSLIIMFMFWMQSQSKYIFKDRRISHLGNSWKWFYYGNPHTLKIKIRYLRQNRESAQSLDGEYDTKSVDEYVQGLMYTMKGYIDESIGATSKVRANIQQLYLMQVHNYYKNRQHMQLASFNERLLKVTLVLVIISIIVVIIVAVKCPTEIASIVDVATVDTIQ